MSDWESILFGICRSIRKNIQRRVKQFFWESNTSGNGGRNCFFMHFFDLWCIGLPLPLKKCHKISKFNSSPLFSNDGKGRRLPFPLWDMGHSEGRTVKLPGSSRTVPYIDISRRKVGRLVPGWTCPSELFLWPKCEKFRWVTVRRWFE